ncbi:MAG: ABC transporter permease [Candidatus Omnitrophica bacterium]|nr:ABC transporter permease [Candidatus Omnitrophota bacterium]
MGKIIAFIKKDFQIFLSYKLFFMLRWAGIVIPVVTFYFISKFIDQQGNIAFSEYRGGYFPFVVIGLSVYGYLLVLLRSASEGMRQEQMYGTLEVIFATPVKSSIVAISAGLWNSLIALVAMVVCLVTGILLFKEGIVALDWFALFLTLIMIVVNFLSIGILAAAVIVVCKRGDPIAWFASTFFAFFGGVYYPVSVLPKGFQKISQFLPITYAVRALRKVILAGATSVEITNELVVLFICAVCLLPLSLIIFSYAVRRAKMSGSLSYY